MAQTPAVKLAQNTTSNVPFTSKTLHTSIGVDPARTRRRSSVLTNQCSKMSFPSRPECVPKKFRWPRRLRRKPLRTSSLSCPSRLGSSSDAKLRQKPTKTVAVFESASDAPVASQSALFSPHNPRVDRLRNHLLGLPAVPRGHEANSFAARESTSPRSRRVTVTNGLSDSPYGARIEGGTVGKLPYRDKQLTDS